MATVRCVDCLRQRLARGAWTARPGALYPCGMTLEDLPKPNRNPRPQKPNQDPDLHPMRGSQSLVEGFGGLVDELRQLNTDFGLRPYRMFSVVVKWSGGVRGQGDPQVVSEKEFLPTPNIGLEGVRVVMTGVGKNERGEITVTEISPRYTEDDIYALFHLQPVPGEADAFIEIRMDGRDGSAIRRRFTALVPTMRAGKFDWLVKLRRQAVNEHRDTSVDNVKGPALVEQLQRREDSW